MVDDAKDVIARFGSWAEAFTADAALKAATLDHIVHHATVVQIAGEYRLKDKRRAVIMAKPGSLMANGTKNNEEKV